MTRKLALGVLLLFPVLAKDADPDLSVEVEAGPPAQVHFRGKVAAADGVVLALSIRHQRTSTKGQVWQLLDRVKVRVKGGAFEKTFTRPGGLPSGLYKLVVECDKGHQRVGVPMPAGDVRGEASFRVDFTEDLTTPAEAFAGRLSSLEPLWAELDAAYQPLSSRHKDPKAIEEWERFQEPWLPRMAKVFDQCPCVYDFLFPDLCLQLSTNARKIRYFQEDYESLVKTGKHTKFYIEHPEWFTADPSVSLPWARDYLASELAFHVARRVVDYDYDKATEIMKGLKGVPPDPLALRRWEVFRTWAGEDLDRIGKTYLALSVGPFQDAFRRIAPDVPVLLKAGQDLLAAGDLMTTDPVAGAVALAAVQAPLKRAYQGVRERIEASRAAAPVDEPWLRSAAWLTDREKALAEARASGKPILAYTQGSPPPSGACFELQINLFGSRGFAAWSKGVVLYRHDAPGLPDLAFWNASGEPIAHVPSHPTLEDLRATLGKAMKAESRDPAARIERLEARVDMGMLDGPGLEKALQELAPLKPEEEARAASMRILLSVRPVLALADTDRMGAARRCLEMAKAGKVPAGARETRPFWTLVMEAAERGKDAASFALALEAVRKDPSVPETFLQEAGRRLEGLKAK